MPIIDINKSIYDEDRQFARLNRELLAERGLTAVNLVGSPGSGKTMLLEKALPRLHRPSAVITGDIEGSFDAQRLERAGIQAVQLNTHGACHLSPRLVHSALQTLELPVGALVIIENVGNLVCPATIDLGEAGLIAVLSAAEGHEKPLKYPALFQRAAVTVITKTDLAAAAYFDIQKAREAALQMNPKGRVMALSAVTGEGMEAFLMLLTECNGAL